MPKFKSTVCLHMSALFTSLCPNNELGGDNYTIYIYKGVKIECTDLIFSYESC